MNINPKIELTTGSENRKLKPKIPSLKPNYLAPDATTSIYVQRAVRSQPLMAQGIRRGSRDG